MSQDTHLKYIKDTSRKLLAKGHIGLLGIPGCGKGTQEEALRNLGYVHFGMSDKLRFFQSEHISKSLRTAKCNGIFTQAKEAAIRARTNMLAGKLAEDADIFIVYHAAKIFDQDSQGSEVEPVYLFDGFPRTGPQTVNMLKNFRDNNEKLHTFVYVEIPIDLSVERQILRGQKNTQYNDRITRGEISGHKRAVRNTDLSETLARQRAIEEAKKIEQVIDELQKENLISRVDGNQSVAKVSEDIYTALMN